MNPRPANFYSEWRQHHLLNVVVRDAGDAPPPERLLQAIWLHQRIRRDELTTSDGRTLRVLHPGFRNHEAGPDFKGAVLQFDTGPWETGDIEVDVQSGGWEAHHHDRNPAFAKVILQVVWQTPKPSTRPTLALAGVLDASLEDLRLGLGSERDQRLPESMVGLCTSPLRTLSTERVLELLRAAARTRLDTKAAVFEARARQAGWEQALWEGVFRALGYKQNVWPMQRLAELRDRSLHEGHSREVPALQARLLGLAGLIPAELTRGRSAANDHVRGLWHLWWRERDAFSDCLLPKNLWRFHGLRPANHPQRRLALAAHWMATPGWTSRIETWLAGSQSRSPHERASQLLDLLQAPPDPFWSSHWTLRGKTLAKPQPLIGMQRATDLAVNAILPWLWARASQGRNDALTLLIEHVYFAWPPSEDNAVLRLARSRLLGGISSQSLRSAAVQQGLLQIVRDFCDHSNSICTDCPFPDLVREWTG